jgi:hypothetical protein
MDGKTRELINRDVDGTVSEAEHVRVQRLLKRSTEARQLHEELSHLQGVLSSVTEAVTPVHLQNRIRAAVHAGDVQSAEKGRPWREAFLSLVHYPTGLRYGSLFAGGLVAGVLLMLAFMQPVNSGAVPDESAAGSILARAETVDIVAGNASGSVRVMHMGSSSQVAVRVTLGHGIVTRLTFDPSRVTLKNIRGPETPSGSLMVRDGTVELSGTGIQTCTLELVSRTQGALLSVSLVAAEGELVRKTMSVTE